MDTLPEIINGSAVGVVLAVIALGIARLCSKPTLYNTPPEYWNDRFVIMNDLTGNLAFSGRLFKTDKKAIKALNRLAGGKTDELLDGFSLHQVKGKNALVANAPTAVDPRGRDF